MIDFTQLEIFKLDTGAHKSAEQGVCAMEAVAWLEGLPHSDSPACTCPVICAFVRGINDAMPVKPRQRLIAFLPRLVGTVAPEFERARAEYLARTAVTVIAPLALDAHRFPEEAAKLRALPADASMRDLRAAATNAAAATAAAAAAAYATNAAAAAYAATAYAAAAYAAAAYATNAAAAAAAAAAYATNATNATNAAAYYVYAYAAANAANTVAHAYAYAYATNAYRAKVWDAALSMLDGVLKIGPAAAPFAPGVEERATAYHKLVNGGA